MSGLIIALISGAVWFYIFLYTKKREVVSKHEGSLFYKAFDYTDHVIEEIIKFSTPSIKLEDERNAIVVKNKNTKPLNDLHEYLEINDIISIKESMFISFSFDNKIKKSEISSLKRNIQNIFMFVIFLPLIVIIASFYPYFSYKGELEEGRFIIFLLSFFIWFITSILAIVKFMNSCFEDNNFLFDLCGLLSKNTISVTINDEMVFMHGYWSNFVAKNKDVIKFGYEGEKIRIGIFLETNKNKIWLFRYPRFYSNKLFNSNELGLLVEKFNAEIAKTKKQI